MYMAKGDLSVMGEGWVTSIGKEAIAILMLFSLLPLSSPLGSLVARIKAAVGSGKNTFGNCRIPVCVVH